MSYGVRVQQYERNRGKDVGSTSFAPVDAPHLPRAVGPAERTAGGCTTMAKPCLTGRSITAANTAAASMVGKNMCNKRCDMFDPAVLPNVNHWN